MLEALEPLVNSNVISGDTKKAIEEAWESKLKETRDVIEAELRAEFAKRYEHDKGVMVESLDKMVKEGLAKEIAEFKEDKKMLAKERVNYKKSIGEHAKVLKTFVLEELRKEIKELHADRYAVAENFAKLEEFIVTKLAEEIKEFDQDKKDVIETKVKLISEAKKKFAELKQNFVKKSAKVVETTVEAVLRKELAQLKEDITASRENNFGRRMFEAFASEYTSSYLNEKGEVNKLIKKMTAKQEELESANKTLEEKDKVIEAKEAEAEVAKDQLERSKVMDQIMSPLSGDKKEVMQDLLQTVETKKLKESFSKYLPAVMDNETKAKSKILAEGRSAVTGNKASIEDDTGIEQMRKLAGI
jgi:hypothetical protein